MGSEKAQSENAVVGDDLCPGNFEKGKECSTLSENTFTTEKASGTGSCQWVLIAELMAEKWPLGSTQVWPGGLFGVMAHSQRP